jgi:methionyl-tRNA formyltransferase
MTSKLVLLCGRTARSSAYAQTLAQAGIIPDAVIIYGDTPATLSSQRSLEVQDLGVLFCPDVRLDVFAIANKYNWTIYQCDSKYLDSKELQSALDALNPDLLVYSGYGGQLVPVSILSRCKVLHVHSGWLPDYRGSTTLYHEVVEHSQCAASALYLDESIDTGPILMRQRYPMPPAGIDVDYLYDNAIRADLLVKVLSKLLYATRCLEPLSQDDASLPYFIIHPLLKHLALLAIDAKGSIDE